MQGGGWKEEGSGGAGGSSRVVVGSWRAGEGVSRPVEAAVGVVVGAGKAVERGGDPRDGPR
jgi:hypothetical protein